MLSSGLDVRTQKGRRNVKRGGGKKQPLARETIRTGRVPEKWITRSTGCGGASWECPRVGGGKEKRSSVRGEREGKKNEPGREEKKTGSTKL